MIACNKCSVEARKVLGARAQAYHDSVNDVKRCNAKRTVHTTVKINRKRK